MRGLVSSTCWLFLIAILAVFTSVSGAVLCDELDENGDLFQQMKTCIGSQFKFKTDKEKEFDLSKLDQATADKILYKSVKGNPDPTKPKTFAGNVKIIDSELEKLYLDIENLAVLQSLKIVGNKKLNTLQLHFADGIKMTLILKGNKHLSMGSIKKINKIGSIDPGSSTIQEFQDCYFDGKVKTLDDLKECSAVEGDLIIDQDTTIPSTMPFIQIEKIKKGCLRIENSKLTSIDFLVGLLDGNSKDKCADGGQSHIKGNKQLCIPSEDWPKWNAIYPLTYAGTCRDRCKLEFALANKDATTAPCDIVVGDVKITGDHRRRRQSDTPPQLAHWDRVKELEGTLEISNTNLEKIVIFNNLERITNPSPEKIALAAIKNPKMIKFDLPKLENITMPSNTWSEPMFFLDNGNFSFSYDDGERWKSITGRGYLSIPMDPPQSTTAAPTSDITTMSPDMIDKKNKKIREENEDIQQHELYVIIGLVAFVVCLILIIVIPVIVCNYCCNKIGKLVKDDNDLKCVKLTAVVKKEKLKVVKRVKGKSKADVSTRSKKEDLTVAAIKDYKEHELTPKGRRIVVGDADAVKDRQNITRVQMTTAATEIPFKMTDVIMKIDAPEMDFARAHALLTQAPLPKMKYHGKPYRYMEKYKVVFFNPQKLNRTPIPYMQKYDRITVFRYLITHCTGFFVTNAHLLPDIIADCSGAYYTPNNSLLAEIEGPIYVIGDIHEALHVLHTILNLDLDGEGKKHKIHPMFRHRYLFLGDYLDKGECGFEVYFLLCIASRLYPSLFTVLRGNHDGRVAPLNDPAILNEFGFRLERWNEDQDEVIKKENRQRINNPHHFTEVVVTDLYEKVTPFLPMAAIINGQTFAAHGAFTLPMATSKKSIRQIFGGVPVPHYDTYVFKYHQNNRYYDDMGRLAQKFEITSEDDYTNRYKQMMKEVDNWSIARDDYTGKEPDYNFESQFPGLNSIMWSDPNPAIASAGNSRGVGCAFTTEHVQKMIENNKAIEKGKSIVDIIRAHQVVGFAQSCDNRVTTIFTNCDNVREVEDEVANLKAPTDILRCSSILRINEDGSRTVVFLSMTTDKKPEQALVNPKRTFKRKDLGLPEVEENGNEKKADENKETENKPQEEKGAKSSDSKDSQTKQEPKSKESKTPKEKNSQTKSNSSENKPKGAEKSTPSKSTTNEKQPKEAKETKGPKEKEKSKGPKASKSSGSKSADEEKKGKGKDKNKK